MAYQAFIRGRTRQTVLEAGTAVELLVNTAVREMAPLRGDSREKVERGLDAPFANRVRDHFARVLDFARDPENSTDVGGAGEVDGAAAKPDVTNIAGYYPIIGG